MSILIATNDREKVEKYVKLLPLNLKKSSKLSNEELKNRIQNWITGVIEIYENMKRLRDQKITELVVKNIEENDPNFSEKLKKINNILFEQLEKPVMLMFYRCVIVINELEGNFFG